MNNVVTINRCHNALPELPVNEKIWSLVLLIIESDRKVNPHSSQAFSAMFLLRSYRDTPLANIIVPPVEIIAEAVLKKGITKSLA